MTKEEIIKEIAMWDAMIDETDKKIQEMRSDLNACVFAQNSRRDTVRELTKQLMQLNTPPAGEVTK